MTTNPPRNRLPLLPCMAASHVVEAGVDEVARGCLLGRVYAAAVVWADPPVADLPKGIVVRDSKQMTRKQRQRTDIFIRERAAAYAVAYREHDFVDRHNIFVGAQEAMRDAVSRLVADGHDLGHIVVDGTHFRGVHRPGSDAPIPHTCVPKGDSLYFTVACASIIAKEEHDRYIHALCDAHPDLDARYALRSNVGYGSAAHRDGIRAHGISQFHRQSFRTCSEPPLNPVAAEQAPDDAR